jgi:hypothetical protein
MTCSEKFQKCFLVCFGVALVAYSLSIGIYESYVGGEAAKLVAEYYDQSVPVSPGSPIRVSIDSLPRDIYKNTKETAYIMLFCGIIGAVGSVVVVGYSAWVRDREKFLLGAALANLVVILLPFCYSAFLTWKLNSLSDADEATWDSIDTGFIDNLHRAEKLLIATVVPGSFWVVVVCVLAIANRS